MSALEELLAAASRDCTETCKGNCGMVPCGPHCEFPYTDERAPACAACKAQREAEAALPRKRDMARAGQALAEALKRAQNLPLLMKTWEKSSRDNAYENIQAALATWNALGEAEEGRDG